jgi:hypothetical protein
MVIRKFDLLHDILYPMINDPEDEVVFEIFVVVLYVCYRQTPTNFHHILFEYSVPS